MQQFEEVWAQIHATNPVEDYNIRKHRKNGMSFQQHLARLRGVVVITALPLTAIAELPTAAEAASLSAQDLGGIYVFGDSLSDVGNSFEGGRLLFNPVWYMF